jgi:hypothetical protein
MSGHTTDPATETFVAYRDLLFTVAYEMLGSAVDAEDVLQETWLRWVKVDVGQVRDQRAYLVRITTRQSLDRLRTMRRRREAYIGFCPSLHTAASQGRTDCRRWPRGRPRRIRLHRRACRCSQNVAVAARLSGAGWCKGGLGQAASLARSAVMLSPLRVEARTTNGRPSRRRAR